MSINPISLANTVRIISPSTEKGTKTPAEESPATKPQSVTDTFQSSITSKTAQPTQIEAQLKQQEIAANLFLEMEVSLQKLQSQSTWLAGQLKF